MHSRFAVGLQVWCGVLPLSLVTPSHGGAYPPPLRCPKMDAVMQRYDRVGNLNIHPLHPRPDACQHLVTDGAGSIGDIIHADAVFVAEQFDMGGGV